MIFFNSMKNLLRARGKTALFFILILILTLLVGLDVNVWSAVTRYLDACDERYTTIGLFEYMGADYPDESVYDPDVAETIDSFDFSQIADNENVLLWDASGRALGYTEGFTRTDSGVYDKNRAVLVIGLPYLAENGLYRCLAVETLYAYQDHAGSMLFVDTNGLAELEEGHYYLVSGQFFDGATSYTYFGLAPFESEAAAAAGSTDIVCLDITDPDSAEGYTLPEDSVFQEIASTEVVLNNCLDVFFNREYRRAAALSAKRGLYNRRARFYGGGIRIWRQGLRRIGSAVRKARAWRGRHAAALAGAFGRYAGLRKLLGGHGLCLVRRLCDRRRHEHAEDNGPIRLRPERRGSRI